MTRQQGDEPSAPVSILFSHHDLSNVNWDRIKDLPFDRSRQHGDVGSDNRLFVSAIRYLTSTSITWADLSTHSGKPNSPWQRNNCWCRTGVRQKSATALRDDGTEWLSGDISRAGGCHRSRQREKRAHATGSQSAETLGHSRDGVGTEAALTGKGYHSDTNRAAIWAARAAPCTPSRSNRTEPIEYDRHLYKDRNAVEQSYARLSSTAE